MEEDDVLSKAATVVYEELEKVGGNPQMLPPLLQPVAILYTVQAMVDNGGFRYIFEGDFPFTPPYSTFSDAYRQIGANDAADLLDRAVALFPFENPHCNQEARNAFMNEIDDSHELIELGDRVCGDERIWQLMEKYVMRNAALFGITVM